MQGLSAVSQYRNTRSGSSSGRSSFKNMLPSVQSSPKSSRLPKLLNSGEDSPGSEDSRSTSSLEVGVSSIQGRRPYQEDQYAVCRFLKDPVNPPDVTPETHFFGVFDGHAGGKCSKAICSTIPYQLSRDESFITKLPLALRRAIQRTNDQFLEIAGKMRLNDGSTGVMVVLRGKTLVTANVGDSRAVLISARKAIALTDDHKPSLPSETRRIQSFGGNVTYNTGIARVAGVLAVSRAFGNFGLRNLIRADPDITQRDLVGDDHFIVLASDGLWDVYRNAEIADICYSMEKQGSQRTADFLTQSALSKGSMDNITCIVINLRKYVSRMLSQDAIRAKLSQDELHSLGLLKMESGEFNTGIQVDSEVDSSESVGAEAKPYDNGPQGLFTKSKLYFTGKGSKAEPRTLPRSSSTGGRIRTPDVPSEPPSPVATSTPSGGSAFTFSRTSSGAAAGGIASLGSDSQRPPSQGLFDNGHLKSLDGYDVLDNYVSSTAYAKNKAQQTRNQPITLAPQNSPIASAKRPDSARNQLAALPKRPSSRGGHDQYDAKSSPIVAFGMNTNDVEDVPRSSIHSPINTTRHVDRMVLPERKVRNPNLESNFTSAIRKSYSLG